MSLATDLHLVPRLRLDGAIPLLLLFYMPLWRGQGQLYFYCLSLKARFSFSKFLKCPPFAFRFVVICFTRMSDHCGGETWRIAWFVSHIYSWRFSE
jgi:hypothetical protein